MRTAGSERALRLTITAILAFTISLFPAGGLFAVAASPEVETELTATVWKNAYWYEPGATVDFFLEVENEGEGLEEVDIRVKLHRALVARSNLDDFLEGKWRRTILQREVIDEAVVDRGTNQYHFNLTLPRTAGKTGVYPVTVELLSEGEEVAEGTTEVVVYSSSGFPQLDLVMVWEIAEIPQVDPQGRFVDDSLARDIRRVGDEGWLYYLTEEIIRHESIYSTLAIAPSTLDDLSAMSGTHEVMSGGKVEEIGEDSLEATDAVSLLNTWRLMAGDPRFQLLGVPYAYPDLESLVALGWSVDARDQLSRGLSVADEVLGADLTDEYLFPPLLSVDMDTLTILKERGGEFLVTGQEQVDRAPGVEDVAEGLTISRPVTLVDSRSRSAFAAVADERLGELIEERGDSGDYRETVQLLVSELTSLFLERPAIQRMCVVHWPGDIQPPREALAEMLDTIAGVPFVRTVTLGGAMFTVNPVSEVRLKIPGPESKPDGYYEDVARARTAVDIFSDLALPDNPLLEDLETNLLLSESALWESRGSLGRGEEFVEDTVSRVEEELGKIRFTGESSFTITTEKTNLPVSVNNGTGYKVEVRMSAEAPELYFPEGETWEQVLEPKENVLEVPVEVRKKGQFDLELNMYAGDREVDGLVIRASTSRFNLFALPVLGAILGLLLLLWVLRVLLRRRRGEHKRRGKRTGREEEAPGA